MGESLPHSVLRRVVEEVREDPSRFSEVVASYLPLLMKYASSLLSDDERAFARFKLAFLESWRYTFGGEIPPPDFEGIYDYEVLVGKLMQHVAGYRDRLPKVLRLWGIYPAVEVEARVRLLIAGVLFGAILDLLRFEGVIP